MYLQHFALEHSPFTRQPNLDVFFAQAGRKNILKDLLHDLQQGNAAMLLTGPKESGKTLFCRLVRHRLEGSSRKVVYLENPVGSFDELLRQICLKLGMSSSVDTGQDMPTVLHALLQSQKEKGCPVLLLIDESEKMFLAALERLFRLLHEVNEVYGVQALLVGLPTLHASIDQLSSYCKDVRITSAYELEAFSAEETGAYLAYRLRTAGDGRGSKSPVFSENAVLEVFRLGQGLPGVIDGIAEVALENAAAAGASSVLPVHVAVPNNPVASPLQFDDEESGGRRTGLLLLLLLCLLAFFFFGRVSFFLDQEDKLQETVHESVGVVPENTEISLALPKDEEAPLPFVEEGDRSDYPVGKLSPKDAGEPSLFPLPVPLRPDFKNNPNEGGAEDHKVIKHVGQQYKKIDKNIVSGVVESVDEKNIETRQLLSPEELKQAVQVISSDGAGTETLATAKKLPVIKPTLIIELVPGMKKTRLPAAREPAPKFEQKTEQKRKKAAIAPPKSKILIPVASARGVVAPAVSGRQQIQTQIQAPVAVPVQKQEKIRAPKINVTPVAPQSASAKTDQLFARYLGAGNRWTKEAYGNKFTVQLLVLSADDAAVNIKNMIVRDEYQEHRRKLYILHRNTIPPTFFVCYGVYNSMDEARNARNTMPLFLRKHHPYALSISDVLAKARD
ncbi:Type II secretory pathway, component ExeA (predicted ATPase) [Candidatus Electrothrix aarhusensis]|jgi:type II secretory pathway predicted ATPase ExeA/septal ring-binding cell division protein DamX|uniref:Type II secretory pathway, component ExeA (Predicted ATPase) n=1 Tax=Candidatus Electrothrix aarhusensis TaxID=1859131 RepID=A0A444J2R4_9BACT|nr:Type II secretory pathway, component ExeA (predicted ATPase) [Candidatus Electrothrix aarhusensis]